MNFKVPKEIEQSINIRFLEQLQEEMHCVFGLSLDMFEMNDIFQKESTTAFITAFLNACKKLKKEDLVNYVKTLDWYESDLFDDYLIDRMKEEKLILPEDEETEIEKQLGISSLEVYECLQCNQFYKKEDVIQLKDEETEELVSACKCKNCSEGNNIVSPLQIDRKKAILHYLKYKENEVFYCENCKKYYLKKWKKGNICHHCDILQHSRNETANHYYLRARTIATKWSSSINSTTP